MHQGATKYLESCSFHLEKHCTCDRALEMLHLLMLPRCFSPAWARKSSRGNKSCRDLHLLSQPGPSASLCTGFGLKRWRLPLPSCSLSTTVGKPELIHPGKQNQPPEKGQKKGNHAQEDDREAKRGDTARVKHCRTPTH